MMKLVVLIGGGVILYLVLRQVFQKSQLKKYQKFLAPGLVVFICLMFVLTLLHDAFQPDKQCLFLHQTDSKPPLTLTSAQDYLAQGDYDYDRGDCGKAIADYTQAISMNSNLAEAYNNRAYTYMRMRTYDNALPDLDRAIQIRPNYVNAIMNRGDVYNFYLPNKQKAIADYDKAISLGATQRETSVCGHRELALHGWRIGTFRLMFRNPDAPACD